MSLKPIEKVPEIFSGEEGIKKSKIVPSGYLLESKINELIEVVNEQSETILKMQDMLFKTQNLLFSSLQLPKGNMNDL